MKKVLLISLPVLAVLIIAAAARTEPDKERDPQIRDFDHRMVLRGDNYRIGIVFDEVRPSLKEKLNIDSGVEVEEVLPDSPAEKAGIKEGDILLKIDGTEVSDPEDVRRFMRKLDEARKITLNLLRDGKPLTLSVTPEKRAMAALMRGFNRNHIGIQLQELDSDLASYFKVEPGAGALVAKVEREGPAGKAGIRSGDIITRFNGEKISSPENLREKLNDVNEGESVEITVIRHGAEKKFTVQPEKEDLLRDFPGMRSFPLGPEFRDDMEDLKLEIENLKKELEERLKPEIQKLKKQLEDLKKST